MITSMYMASVTTCGEKENIDSKRHNYRRVQNTDASDLTQNIFFHWRGVVDDGTWLAKCNKKSYETQVRFTYNVIIRWSSQKAYKLVAPV